MKPIANITPNSPFLLAPMEAVNCASFRLLCKQRGAGIVYTDMIDADLFTEYARNNSTEEAIKKYINPQKEEQPLAVQLAGPKAENIIFTANSVKQYCKIIDINIGCPLGYMLGKKGGAYLMKHPDQLYKLLKQIRPKIQMTPLTIKMRSGWDNSTINAVDIAVQAEKLGIDAISIHPRTRKQGYKEKADWSLVKKIKNKLNIPVILSGDVFNTWSAEKAFRTTNCDYIMIGRAARANPSIFTQLNEWYKTKQPQKQPVKRYDKREADPFKDFTDWLSLYKKFEHRYNLSEIKDHAIWTATDCIGSKTIKQQLLNTKSEKEIIDLLKKIKY